MLDWKMFIIRLIIELGGFTGIIILVIKFLGKILGDTFWKKYELIINEKLEFYKKTIDNK